MPRSLNAARIRIPGTNLDVSPLCLGGAQFGSGLDRASAFALLDAFVEGGGNFVDTAHVYGDWIPGGERQVSEKTIGRWLTANGVGAEVVVSTKIGHPYLETMSEPRLDAAALRADAIEALANLGRETLDLVYLHRDDRSRPVADILGPVEEMRREGLIRQVGLSNWTLARMEEARREAKRAGWPAFVANQPEWSVAWRNPDSAADDLVQMDAPMFAFHQRTGIAAIPYSAQARGYFDKAPSGRLGDEILRAYENPRNRRLAAHVAEVARETGAAPTAIALAALRTAPFAVIPVVGCRTADQLRSTTSALGIDVPDDLVGDLAALPADEDERRNPL